MTRTAHFDDLIPANSPSNTDTVMPPVPFGVLAAVALGFGLEQEITIVLFNSEASS